MSVEQPSRHPDGHVLLDGARWHYPKKGSPTECAVPGCTRVLGQQRPDPLAADDTDVEQPEAA